MEPTKQEIAERKIYRGIWKLLFYETPAEFEAVLVEHPELLTQHALDILRGIVSDIPETEADIHAEWGRRAKFLAGKIDAVGKS